MDQVLAAGPAGATQTADVHARRRRDAVLHRAAALCGGRALPGRLDSGFRIERSYAPYVEQGTRPHATSYKAGDLVRVTLTFHLTKERRYVAVTDPLPAGFEPVESWFATTAASLSARQDDQGDVEQRPGSRGGSAADSITSSATTTASSCLRRA